MGIASLILGIIAVIFGLWSIISLGSTALWGAILGLIGIILGALGRKNPDGKGIATAGLVLSIIGLVFSLLVYIACIACVAAL